MIRFFRLTDVVYLLPLIVLLFIGGPWSRAKSPLPVRPDWNIIAPEGTSLSVIEMSPSVCRVKIERVNTKIKDPIRIERKIVQADVERGRIDYQLNGDPPRQISANVYQRHAPWRTIQNLTLTFIKDGDYLVSCSIHQQLLDNDGAIAFFFEPKLGLIQVQSYLPR
jgi:hypothetical protein